MIAIRSRRLLLRNWEERDRDLHRINSDDRVMKRHALYRLTDLTGTAPSGQPDKTRPA